MDEQETFTEERKPFAKYLAKALRVITVPAILVAALIVTLYFAVPHIFRGYADAVWAAVFLGAVPVAAYPFQYAVPALRRKGRNCHSKLTFIFSIAGYTAALIYGITAKTTPELLSVFTSYFVSVVILTFVNKALKIFL